MHPDPAVLIADFSAAAGALGMDGWPCTLRGELLSRSASSGGPAAGFGAVNAGKFWIMQSTPNLRIKCLADSQR